MKSQFYEAVNKLLIPAPGVLEAGKTEKDTGQYPSRAEFGRFKKLNIVRCVTILNLCYLFKNLKSRAMKKKAPKEVIKKISKKDKRKSIETKLEDALSGMKNEFSEKKFRHLVKKAGKLFSTGTSTAAKPKRQKPKKAAKKTTPEINAAQQS